MTTWSRQRTAVAAIAVTLLLTACGASPRVEREVAARRAAGVVAQRPDTGPEPLDTVTGPAPSGSATAAGEAADSTVSARAGPGFAQTPAARPRPATGAGAASSQAAGAVTAASGPTAVSAGSSRVTAPTPSGGNGGSTDVGVTAISIKIGGLFFNGSYLDKYSQVAEQAATAYFRYVNDQGGIFGRKIDYVTCDTAGMADGTQGCLRKLANDDKVFAMGSSLDYNLDTVQPFLADKKLPWIGSSGLYPEEFQSPWMFPTQVKGKDVGGLSGTFAKRTLGVATVGISYLTDGAGPSCLAAVKDLGQRLGYEVVVTVENNQTQGDLTQQVLTVKSKNPDGVIFCNDPINTVKFVQAAGRVGYRPPKGWVAGWVAADDIPKAMGAAGVGLYGFSAYDFYRGDAPGIRKYREITEYYYPSIFHHFYTQSAFVGAAALVQALQQAGPALTRAALLNAIRSIRDFDTGMGLRLNFADIAGGSASGIMLQVTGDLRWQVAAERFPVG